LDLRIIGAGISGSFFHALAKDGYDLKIYDKAPARRGHGCAWGVAESRIDNWLRIAGLNYKDYVMSRCDTLVINGVPIKIDNLIIIDKPQLLEDLVPTKSVIHQNVDCFRSTSKNLMVNATSIPLGEYNAMATKQHKIKTHGFKENTVYIYISPKHVGYSWLFPLDSSGEEWHFGAGCTNDDPVVLLEKFIEKYKLKMNERVCLCDRSINVVNPDKNILYKENIVSIGEAAGVVPPLSGEGIIPSLESAFYLCTSIFGEGIDLVDFKTEYSQLMGNLMLGFDTQFSTWDLMNTKPRKAWLKCFNSMSNRTEKKINPQLTPWIKLKLLKEILLG